MNVMMMVARKMGCDSCIFYDPKVVQEGCRPSGECRNAPPRTSSQSKWPRVFADDFCGSFEPLSESVIQDAFAPDENELPGMPGTGSAD